MLIHLTGIGGTGMGNLAVLLRAMGHRVRGSDSGIYPPMDSILAQAGVEVMDGYGARNLSPTPDLVVVGNVCRPDHAEARAAIERGLSVASMPAALRGLVLHGRRPLVVAGTHGKTTTSAILVHLLQHAGKDPGFLVGGRLRGFESGARPGEGPWFVIEGDEYDSAFFEKWAKFLSYDADGLILTSVEHDHVDIYPTWRSYLTAFERLVTGLPRAGCLVTSADSDACTRLAPASPARTCTYSVTPGQQAAYRATDIRASGDGTRFNLFGPEGDLGEFFIPLTGAYNVANAAAAAAMCIEHACVGTGILREALSTFPGVARRLDSVGKAGGVEVLDDFGHHPTAVGVTLDGLRASIPSGGRIIAVLRPASATACRALHHDQWADALCLADVAVLAPLARTNIPEGERLDQGKLALDVGERGGCARLASTIAEVPALVASEASSGDTVVFFSNTDPGSLIEDTLSALSSR